MGIIMAKVWVKCPLEGIDVALNEKCINCAHYNHIGMQGSKIYIFCDRIKEPKELT